MSRGVRSRAPCYPPFVHTAARTISPGRWPYVPQGRSARVDGRWFRPSTTRDPADSSPRRRAAAAGRTHPPAQSRGRGVGPRGHAPVPGRHRLGHGDLQARGLLQVVPRPHLRGHHLPVQPRGAGRLGDRDRGAPPPGAARDHRRSLGVRLPPGQHALDRQRRVLRQDRRGAGPAAPAGVGGGGDHRARLQPSRGRLRGARPGREPGVRSRPAPGGRLDDPAARAARRTASTTSSSSSPGASRSPAWPPATPTSTSSWPGSSRRT